MSTWLMQHRFVFICRQSRFNPIRNEIEFLNVEQMSECLKWQKDKPLWKWIIGCPQNEDNTNDVPEFSPDIEAYLNERLQGYHDICCGSDDERIAIYAVNSYHIQVYTCSVTTRELLWSFSKFEPDGMKSKMKPSSITTDGHGHLFICDMANNCIQIFYTDGTYICPLDCNGKLELGTPERIDWSKTESALIVTHRLKGKYLISVLKVQINPN